MQRYFVDKIGDDLILNKEQIHQIISVMRSEINEKITLVNDGNFYHCVITSLNPFKFEIIEIEKGDSELKKDITLLYCLPKKDKLELVIQKATELGVKQIVLVNSSRTIMKIKKEDEEKKLQRYSKIALEASEQSKRTSLPIIGPIIEYKDINKYLKDISLIAYENENKLNLNSSLIKDKKTISILIGAEGGFSKEEVEYAEKYGFKSVSLGKRILRSETAVYYCLSLLSYFSEE